MKKSLALILAMPIALVSLMAADISPAKLKLFRPLPASMDSAKNPATEAKINLGRMLYYEPRLSKSQEVSCNTCHSLDAYGADNEPTSAGHTGLHGNRNSPTVYNAAGHFRQFWDGRAADVEEQAKGPVMNPVEMAMPSEKVVVAVLKSMPEYVAAFKKAFPGQANPISFDNMANAIGAFERRLVTPSRWDQFLNGRQSALTEAEKAGFNKFLETGCAACHNGAYLGGASYQKLGIAKPWPKTNDLGRYALTKQASDKMSFKVPSLRNIDKTGPYYHDGSVGSLPEAVRLMAAYQNGVNLKPQEVESIVAWLRSLTGELPASYIRKPQLPKSTSATPKPSKT